MLILGIDTGGTYTDGVILDRETRTVLHTAKALTTPENLSAGITACMRALCFSGWEQIGMVGLSTTLATNAIVEGRGCRVGLLPLIWQLLRDVRSVMDALRIRAPLMIVRGDGSLMDAAYAAERPVETVLSGPAASVTGAQFLSGLRDGLVVDMGGTTTDIAALSGGMCSVSEEGALLSGWRTRVRALEIRTFGLGGDSEIVLRPDGSVRIGPRKVVPLCRAAVTAGRAGLREAAAACGIPAEKLERRLTDAVVRQLAADCREGAAAEAGSILIGVGAPARSWLTAAAAQLGWPCVVPRCAEVANAVGAAAGQVCESARALVRHNRLNDCFYVYTESCRMEAEHLRAAQELARGAVRRTVLEKAARAGAEAPEVTLREQLTAGEDGAFVEWCVAADAKGYPSAKYKGNPPDFTGG